ncbi:MAG: TrkA family potassium uptake protein, partial [Clostridia bacterium]|nr:TrkA family potassium uptake protein [Clostridia bacterium]
MSINKSYAVFGLGRYGRAVAKELLDNGAAVLAVDRNRKLVDELAGEIPLCKCADITVPGVIEQLGIADFDVVIIAIAGNFEATVMATMLCKEAGVKRVIVKCAE